MKLRYFLSLFSVLVLTLAFKAEAATSEFFNQWTEQGVPAKALRKALAYRNSTITNHTWLLIADYTADASEQRLYILNLHTGDLAKSYVSHGVGSDDGTALHAVRFSNTDNSLKTSPGFMRIGDLITSPNYGPAFHLDGLEARNNLVSFRLIILHAADYTSEDYIAARHHPGLSQGCPAVPPAVLQAMINENITGSLFYSYTSLDAK